MLSFFDKLRSWRTAFDEPFLRNAEQWLKKQPKQSKPNSAADLQAKAGYSMLQKMYLQQLAQEQSKDFSWLPFLKSAQEELRLLIEQQWAELFYNGLGDLYAKACHIANVQCQAEESENGIKDPCDQSIAELYEQLVRQRYLSNRSQWEKYLADPQSFYEYLKSLFN